MNLHVLECVAVSKVIGALLTTLAAIFLFPPFDTLVQYAEAKEFRNALADIANDPHNEVAKVAESTSDATDLLDELNSALEKTKEVPSFKSRVGALGEISVGADFIDELSSHPYDSKTIQADTLAVEAEVLLGAGLLAVGPGMAIGAAFYDLAAKNIDPNWATLWNRC